MGRKQDNGLQISRQGDKRPSADLLLPLLCGVWLYALARLTGAENTWLPALAGMVVCVLGTRRWLHSAVLGLLVLSLLVFKNAIADGFCTWYNSAAKLYTASSGIYLPGLAASENANSMDFFLCWAGAAMGMGLVFLSALGREAVCGVVLALSGSISLALRRMIDPLPLLLAAAMLCCGRGWKQNVLLWLLLAAFAALAILPGFQNWSGELSEAVLEQVHYHRYETQYTTLPEGRLETLGESDSTALIVTMEKPEVLYLRGFTGAKIEEDRWLPLSNELLAQNAELLYWLNCREFDLRAQFEAAASALETRKNTVTVQNVGACSAYRYIPFTICADERLIPENLTETAAGERYDSFTTVYGGAAMLPELLAALEAEDSRYLQAEAAYREFVEAHYLSVPEELTEKMQPYWDKAEVMDAQEAVLAVLEECYPDGAGHDPYYATAAVLTLRHFGIPARYAEGYILPQTTATTVEVTGKNAACWAEVYHDGIGWLPMALIPGLDGETEQQEEQPQPPDTPEETLPPETEPATEPKPDGGYQVRIAQTIVNGVIIIVLLLVLAAVVLIVRRKMILKKRQALLGQEDIREAITWSFADGVAILERMGIHRGNGSLDALAPPIRERFGTVFAEQFEAAAQLNAKALFSSRPMDEAERETVAVFQDRVLELLRQNANRLQRFWMQYILCLF